MINRIVCAFKGHKPNLPKSEILHSVKPVERMILVNAVCDWRLGHITVTVDTMYSFRQYCTRCNKTLERFGYTDPSKKDIYQVKLPIPSSWHDAWGAVYELMPRTCSLMPVRDAICTKHFAPMDFIKHKGGYEKRCPVCYAEYKLMEE